MESSKTNNKKPNLIKKTTIVETQEIFLKRIKELDIKEQETLLKLYNEIVKEITE